MREVCSINLLFPVLNERLRLQSGIERTMSYLKENVDIPYQVTILDNGSTDETPEIAKVLEEKYAEVTYIRLEERGVGIAFRNGILRNTCTVVGYMDIDLSTDLNCFRLIRSLIMLTEAVSVKNPKQREENGIEGLHRQDLCGY